MKAHWPALDGLRSLAVGIVLFAHQGCLPKGNGGVGVDIFFVLSGFLITGILDKGPKLTNFYVRRFLRLAPCLLLSCFLFALLSLYLGRPWVSPVLITLTYTGNYALALFQPDMSALGPCWSLACEEQFYLLWPFAIILLKRYPDRTKGLILLSLAILVACYRTYVADIYPSHRIYYALDTHADGLVLGSALCYLSRLNLPKIGAKILSYFLVPVSIEFLGFVMWKYGLFSPWMATMGFFLSAISAALIILDLTHSPLSLLRFILSQRPLTYLGKISYGLYLLHSPIFLLTENPLLRFGLTFLIAALSFKFYESPILKLKDRFQ